MAVASTTTPTTPLPDTNTLNSADVAAESMWKHQQEKSPNMKNLNNNPFQKKKSTATATTDQNQEGFQQEPPFVADNRAPSIRRRSSINAFHNRMKSSVGYILPNQVTSLPGNVLNVAGAVSGNVLNAAGQVSQLPGNVFHTFTDALGRNRSSIDDGTSKYTMEDEDVIPSKCFKLRFPQPLRPARPNQLIKGLELNALKYLVISCLVCYFLGRCHFSYFFGFVSILMGLLAYWMLGTETKQGLDWQLEKQQGSKTLYDTRGETVEWMNFFLQKIWRSIDPNIFICVEDILEDTLASLAPAVINAVKVTDLDIGVNAPRIQKIRIFPPLPGQPDESMFGEASFLFQSKPVGSSSSGVKKSTSTPPGIAIRFKTGLKAPIDVKAELLKVRGKLRFKILTSPDMPFVSKVTISFVNVPKVETNVMPVSKHMNVMKLPMMKTLVNEAVKLGFAGLVDPKSMTLDIKELIGAASQDTSAIGVVKVEVRQAKRNATINLQDMKDAFATISSSAVDSKRVVSTRVLTNDEDPRWNENLYILVHQDEILNDTTIDLKVWDADKVKPDDAWGTTSVSVKDIVLGKIDTLGYVSDWCKQERVVFDGWAPLDGKPSLEESEIQLDFRMTFHPKYIAPPAPSLMTALEKGTKTAEQEALEEETWNPIHKSGILSIQVSEGAELEIGDPEMLTADEFKHPYSPNKIVNPYAVIYLNDTKIYETRAKLRNPSPHWDAECEQLVKDYDTAFLRVSVKTSMDLEHDPVLGTRVFYLKDIFVDQQDKFKEAERWVALANGIGFGKVLLNLKYKPVKLSLPRELRGSDVGTMIIDRVELTDLKPPFSSHHTRSTKATLSLNIDPIILKRLKSRDFTCHSCDSNEQQYISGETADDEHHGTMMSHQSSTSTIVWQRTRPLYFPLTMRYRTALCIHVQQGNLYTSKAMGRLWLKTVCDGTWQEATLGLYDPPKGDDGNKNEDDWSPVDNQYGQVIVRFKIVPGYSPVHSHLRSFQMDMLGADPFHDNALKNKVEQWIQEERDQEQDEIQRQQKEMEWQQERRESHMTEVSEVYGDEDQEADKEFLEDLEKFKTKNKKIPPFFVLRKLSRGTDFVRHRIQTVREGFNSDNRASRAVIKE